MVAVLGAAIVAYKVAALRVPFLSLGCKAGMGRSCAALAELYLDERAGTRADAIPVLSRGCERLRDAQCCTDLVRLTATGIGTGGDFAKAEKMCLEGDPAFGMACFRLAEFVVIGRFGNDEREKRAEAFYRRACALGVEQGCQRASTVKDALRKMAAFEQMASACVAGGDQKECDKVHEAIRAAHDR